MLSRGPQVKARGLPFSRCLCLPRIAQEIVDPHALAAEAAKEAAETASAEATNAAEAPAAEQLWLRADGGGSPGNRALFFSLL